MTYKEFIKLLKDNRYSIQEYMRLAGLSQNAYIRWKNKGKLTTLRAMQVRMLLGVSDANKTTTD